MHGCRMRLGSFFQMDLSSERRPFSGVRATASIERPFGRDAWAIRHHSGPPNVIATA